MALVRFDVGNGVDDIRREVNRVFAGLPHLPFGFEAGLTGWLPAMDTLEEDGTLTIMLDIPGAREEDIDVEVSGDVLTIRGSRSIERETEGQQWHRLERCAGSFERCMQVPDGIDAAKVTASLDAGVLTVMLPAAARQEPATRHIDITSATAK